MPRNTVAKSTQVPSVAQLFNYVEEVSHVNDELASVHQPVVFRLFSIGRGLGAKIDISFVSDYGVYYDPDDSYLISALQHACPQVNWYYNKIYHRCWQQSKIRVLNADTGALIGQLETRRYMGRKVKPESVRVGIHGPNVINLEDLRAARELMAEQLEK